MSNRFFNYLTRFVAGTKVRAEQANTRFDEIVAGFDDAASELDTLNLAVGASKAAVSLASATTTLISTAASMNVNLTGVATITAFDTMADGTLRYVTAAGAFTLTHHATALILPGAANIVAAAGDSFILKSLGAGNWRVIDYTRASGKAVKELIAADVTATASGNLAGVTVEAQLQELDSEKAKLAGDAAQDFAAKDVTAAGAVTVGTVLYEHKGADIASAATLNLDAATGNLVDVTGTTTITAITLAEGSERTVRFTGALTITHGASLLLPNGQNINTTANTIAVFRGLGGGITICVASSTGTGRTGLIDVQVFDTAGAATWTKPINLPPHAKVRVRLVGGGGGSLSVTSTASNLAMSWGGGGGAYVEAICDASSLGATEPVTVGSGGGNIATAGEDSSFGASSTLIYADGGYGSAANNLTAGSSVTWTGGGSAEWGEARGGSENYVGTAWTEILTVRGAPATPGIRFSGSIGFPSLGGRSAIGSSGISPSPLFINNTTSNGGNAGCGTGANGAMAVGATTGTGGSGGDGIVIVEVYA